MVPGPPTFNAITVESGVEGCRVIEHTSSGFTVDRHLLIVIPQCFIYFLQTVETVAARYDAERRRLVGDISEIVDGTYPIDGHIGFTDQAIRPDRVVVEVHRTNASILRSFTKVELAESNVLFSA